MTTTNTKNLTRISSLMGTWSAQIKLKSFVGDYQLLAYFVVHLMPNPMRGHGCNLGEECNEIDNQVCMRHIGRYVEHPQCHSMEDRIIDWADGESDLMVLREDFRSIETYCI